MNIVAAIRRWFDPSFDPPGAETLRAARPWTFDPAPLHDTGDRLADAVRHGEHAARLLQDELLLWSLGEMRQRVRDDWEKSPIEDKDAQQVLRLKIELMKEFVAQLQSLIVGGQIAGNELARIEREREFEKRYGKVPM